MKRSDEFTFFYIFWLCLFLGFGLSGQYAVAQNQNKSEGVTVTNQRNELTVYPLPVSTTVHIRISAALRPHVDKLQIINLLGREITEQSLIDPNTTEVSFTNLDQYPSGIYMVLARDKYGKIVKSVKMIINH